MRDAQQPPEVQVKLLGLPQSDACEHSLHDGQSSVLVVARLTQPGVQTSVQF